MICDAAPQPPDLPYSASDREKVPVDPFRERFKVCLTARGYRLTPDELAAEVAYQCDWTVRRGEGTVRPDATRVLRVVGLKPDRGRYRQHVTPETAALLCRVLGLDPWEAGT